MARKAMLSKTETHLPSLVEFVLLLFGDDVLIAADANICGHCTL